MHQKIPHESWFDKVKHTLDTGLKIYGTAQGVIQAGKTIYSGLRSAYQVAQPMMALL